MHINRDLGHNSLTTLPVGVFDALTAMSRMYVCTCLSSDENSELNEVVVKLRRVDLLSNVKKEE